MEKSKRYYIYYGEKFSDATECRVDSYDEENSVISVFVPKYNKHIELIGDINHLPCVGIFEYTEIEGENLETTVKRLYGHRDIGRIEKIVGGKGYFHTYLTIKIINGSAVRCTSGYLYWFSYELPNIPNSSSKFEITSDLIGKHVAIERVDGKIKHVLLLDDRLFRMLDGRYR